MRPFFSRFAPHLLFGTVCLLLSSTACKPPPYPECRRDKHCKVDEGERCVDKICQNCVTDEDCRGKGENGEDLICQEYRCSADPNAQIQPGGLGAPCASTSQCNAGLICKDGKCSNCFNDAECAPGVCNLDTGTCESSAGQCRVDDDCAVDEICDQGKCIFSGDVGNPNEVLCNLSAVYFDFDSPRLRADAQSALRAAAQCIAEQNRLVHLEAHADPRGTTEYNILLTDKRGQSVKSFLMNSGVSADKINVVAKGDLEATGVDESGWSKDRRVQFVWQ